MDLEAPPVEYEMQVDEGEAGVPPRDSPMGNGFSCYQPLMLLS